MTALYCERLPDRNGHHTTCSQSYSPSHPRQVGAGIWGRSAQERASLWDGSGGGVVGVVNLPISDERGVGRRVR